MGFVFDGFCIL